MSEIEKIKDQFVSKLKEAINLEKINQIKSELFGKNGIISNQFKSLASKSDNEKKIYNQLYQKKLKTLKLKK
jgi:phenylalanyl-tRNA synthetase alpha chain